MQFQCKSLLRRLLKESSIRNVLELGSGLHSTSLIYQYLMSHAIDHFVSLEDHIEWTDRVSQYTGFTPTLSKFGYIDGLLKYEYSTDLKFDLVFIDGPGKLHGNTLEIAQKMCNDKKFCLSTASAPGIQSIHLIEYIKPMIHENTRIIVDGRIASVLFYMTQYDDFQFTFSGKTHAPDTVKCILKPAYWHLVDSRISQVTLMQHKVDL